MAKLSDLFDISYGHNLSLNSFAKEADPKQGIAFVSRTGRNNGVSAWVDQIPGVTPLPPGLITVSLRSRNHALASFVQTRPFYCGYHIYVLKPRKAMSLKEKLWWCQCIEANRFKYNFGRQANRSLANLDVPESVPDWVHEATTPSLHVEEDGTQWPDLNVDQCRLPA